MKSVDGGPDISNGLIWKAILTGECDSATGESTFLLSLAENWETCLEDKEESINVTGMDPNACVMYCRTRHRRAKRKFKEAFDHALEERIRDTHAHAAMLSSLFSFNFRTWGRRFVLCELEACIRLMRAHVTDDGGINVNELDPGTYQRHFQLAKQSTREKFELAFHREVTRRVAFRHEMNRQITQRNTMDMRMDVRTATGEILEVLPVTSSTYYPLKLLNCLIKSNLFTWENKVATLHMPEEFAEFLLHWTHGPKLDEGTVNLLSKLMVTNGIEFIQYSIQPFSAMLSQLTV
jgi:hypothetical protein